MAKRNRRVVRYRSRLHLNPGFIIFGIIFVYIAINVLIFFTTDRVNYYEVVSGTISEETYKSYKGLALRDENVQYTDESGYINFYVRESGRVSVRTTLYSIDADGTITEVLESLSDEDTSLTEDNETTIKEQLYNFTNNYDDMSFGEVYDFKNTLQGTVVELINMNALENSIKTNNLGANFTIKKSEKSGILLYRVDGFETKTAEDLKGKDFDDSDYVAATVNSGDFVNSGTPICKTVTDEEWSIAVQFSDEDVKKYTDVNGIKIKFIKDGITTTANLEIVKGSDNNNYGIITLAKYMVRYVTDRYINIQIVDDVTTGLKIPKKSIVEKEVYKIPRKCGVTIGESDNVGFIRTVEKEGKLQAEYYYPPIAKSDDKYYYVSTSAFNEDEVLQMIDTQETFTVSETQSLIGVYQINNGYTVFVQVNPLVETEEYYIVESGAKYGLRVYDHIVLDSSQVKENQIIFQ